MNVKKIIVSTALMGSMALGVGFASAQDNPPPGRPRPIQALIEIVSEETGLEPREIAAQAREGMSLADIITANDGSVEVVIDAAVSEATEQINAALAEGRISQEQADNRLANLEDNITRALNGERFPNRGEGRPRMQAAQALIEAATIETGLEAHDLMQQMHDGSALADIITANGGNVENVVANAVAEATERINAAVVEGRISQEQADELLASLETVFTEAVNGQFPERPGRPGQRSFARGLAQQVAEATGLEVSEVVAQVRDGVTVAELLTANGVDVTNFTNDVIANASERLAQAVENGRITQERADEMIAQLIERLLEILNSSHPADANA
jgi:hypothetical protein